MIEIAEKLNQQIDATENFIKLIEDRTDTK